MKEHRIGGIPVIAADRTLIGIVTNRDLRFQKDTSRKIEEVMTKEGSSPPTTPTSERRRNPAQAQDRETAGGRPCRKTHWTHHLPRHHQDEGQPNACKDDKGRLRVAAGVGVTADVLDRVAALTPRMWTPWYSIPLTATA